MTPLKLPAPSQVRTIRIFEASHLNPAKGITKCDQRTFLLARQVQATFWATTYFEFLLLSYNLSCVAFENENVDVLVFLQFSLQQPTLSQ